MTAETFTQIKVTSLRHKHIGRRVNIIGGDALEDFRLDEVTGVIESLSVWRDGVSVGVDYWDDWEQCTVAIEVEFTTDECVSIGGAS